MHPVEMLGDDWYRHGDWGIDVVEAEDDAEAGARKAASL